MRSQNSINCTTIVPGASKSALRRDDLGSIAVSVSGSPVIVVPIGAVRIVSVRIIAIIWEWSEEWREERETKRVGKDKRSIVEVMESIIPAEVSIV